MTAKKRAFLLPPMRPALKSALRGAIDLILPPQAFDGGARPMSEGLSGAAWSRIQFLENPVCDGCGQPVVLITTASEFVKIRPLKAAE